MDYLKYSVQTELEFREILMAFFGQYPFDTFEEVSDGFNAYLPDEHENRSVRDEIETLKTRFEFSYRIEKIPAKNWNKEWEDNFQPVIVDDFCAIRAEFHELAVETKHEVLIHPKMSFGTGHHATTYMMIEAMSNYDFTGATVLDYGCGTGVLAILAAKMGAESIDGIDIDSWAYENSVENCHLNDSKHVKILHGDLDKLSSSAKYSFILANINKNVLLGAFEPLHKMLTKSGKLILSGVLQTDQQEILDALDKNGFHLEGVLNKGDWSCIKAAIS